VDRDTAGTLYAKQFSGAALNPAEEKAVEDYLFNDIAARAGALGLVVHIHTGNVNGPYFNNSRANPGLLEPAIDSEPLHHTNFVLLHGGWPFYLIAEAMMDKPNVYGDFSAPDVLSDTARAGAGLESLAGLASRESAVR
jgi:uncharacterized protein